MKSELLEHLLKLAAKGGKKRWSNTSKRQRAEEMSRLAKLRWDKTQDAQPGLLHPVVMEWQYSRNQLRHEVLDGEVYKHKGDFYQLFEIRSNRNPYEIRKSSDTHRLLHKGRMVAENKSVKALKETAAKLHND